MLNERTKKTRWALKLTAFVGVSLLLVVAVYLSTRSQNATPAVIIGDTGIHVEIATSSQEHKRGLCCRDSLDENAGMLFVYANPSNNQFWMKDTRIPLDMYWLDSEKKIVHIEENVQPDSYPKTFGTNIPPQYVLETNAGFAERHNINVGDQARFEL